MSHESPKPEDRVVGHVLRSAREGLGLSQEDAAEVTGLHRAQYGRYEAGQNAPTFLTVIQIARRLGVPASDIAGEAERQIAALEQREGGDRD